jgi:hypothetical protein
MTEHDYKADPHHMHTCACTRTCASTHTHTQSADRPLPAVRLSMVKTSSCKGRSRSALPEWKEYNFLSRLDCLAEEFTHYFLHSILDNLVCKLVQNPCNIDTDSMLDSLREQLSNCSATQVQILMLTISLIPRGFFTTEGFVSQYYNWQWFI